MKRLLFICLGLFFVFDAVSQAYKIDPIVRDSAFNVSNKKIVESIQLVGNKVTKAKIIKRELTFDLRDTLGNDEFIVALEQSRKNILNTSLFNFAKIDIAMLDSNRVLLVINLVERWYIFPLPIFEIDDNNFNIWWRDKDFSRINYGIQATHENFTGRKDKLSITAKYGFTERYRIRYNIPYIDKKQKSGLSFSFSYNRRDEIVYTTLGNERLQYKNKNNDALRNYSGGISYQLRKKIFNTHTFGVEYDYNSVVDSVVILNPNYLGGSSTKSEFISLFYSFTNDKRDSRNYPLKGHYFNFNVRKYGLGLIENTVDLTNFQVHFKKFVPLSPRFYFAGSIRGVVAANNNQPYLLQNGLGYSSFSIRSYEYYVIDGQDIGLAKFQLRYQLLKPRSTDIGILSDRIGKFHYAFYLGIFSDFGYVQDNTGFQNNDLANSMQYGSGIGLDFVSYYDIVIRSEFSINKFGESGFFFHFVAPI
ncbi:MAG: hypothetical protein RJQ00_13770 [Vicingaceae bacterium]